MSNEIRVRFAPSPTGYLHIGGLRTALYCYLYARKTKGKFILRIEDTDRSRYVEGSVENLLSSLRTVGLEYDEGPDMGGEAGPYIQSQRTDIYRRFARELISKDAAYYCFCTSEELEKQRQDQLAQGLDTRYNGHCRDLTKEQIEDNLNKKKPYVIRLKIPQKGEVVFYDLVRDRVAYPWSQIDDQIILKSDGFPTYHLANVVDDHLMEISHVIRGEEWLSSTPKHIFIYQVFDWKLPKWVHLPLILNSDKSKLSKRQGDVSTEDFLKKGYLPEALLNFIALLGWHAKGDRELFSIDELINEFSLKRISKSGAVFDPEKLKWMNSHYLKTLESGYIAIKAKPFFKTTDLNVDGAAKFEQIIDFVRERAVTLADFPQLAKPFFEEPDFSAQEQLLISNDLSQQVYKYWLENLGNMNEINDAAINDFLKETSQTTGAQGKKLYFPLRLALFGSEHGPELSLIVSILGIEKCLERLKKVVKF